jgi:hypothetical protein
VRVIRRAGGVSDLYVLTSIVLSWEGCTFAEIFITHEILDSAEVTTELLGER